MVLNGQKNRNDRYTIVIVDDSEIDRMILTEILKSDFNVIEKENGYAALEFLLNKNNHFDCVLLDIKMPIIDGFEVLRLMAENRINVPVFLTTVEATKQNVEKASEYEVKGFIVKPYQPEVVLKKLKLFFNIPEEEIAAEEPEEDRFTLTEAHLVATDSFILRLHSLYDAFMSNMGISNSRFRRVSDIFSILLRRYNDLTDRNSKLTEDHIRLASQAAYFYDIGMMVQPKELQPVSSEELTGDEGHTSYGAKLICLNQSPLCSFFVDVCSDICMHHHEHWDGSGYPHRLKEYDIRVMPQLVSIAIEFDRIFVKRTEFNERNFEFTLKELSIKRRWFGSHIFNILSECRTSITRYYQKNCRPADKQ
ncbi:MAG: response regulator [Anaerovoracaceae bacterium]